MRAFLLAVALSLVAAASAHGCACVAISPGQKLRDADAAFVGTVASFRDEGASRIYTVEVAKVYKGAVGPTAEVRGGNPDDGTGSDCDEAFAVGGEAGGYFKGPPQEWFVGTCNRATRQELDRAAEEAGTAGEPPPRPSFIARGPFDGRPFATTDAMGRAIAYAPARSGSTGALSACPGGDHLLDGVTIRRTSDLEAVGTLGDGDGGAPAQVRCLSADGQVAVGFTASRDGARGTLVRLTPGAARPLAKGPWAMAALGSRRSALAAIHPAGTLVVVDNATGSRRVVRRARRACVDLELSPGERRVAETVSGRPVTQALVHDLARRRALRRRVEGHDLVWFRRDRIAVVGYDNHARVYDARLRPVSPRFLASDGSAFAASGDLWWIRSGELHRRGAPGYPVKLTLITRGPLVPVP